MVSNEYVGNVLKNLTDFRGTLPCDFLKRVDIRNFQRSQFVVNTGESFTGGQHFIYLEINSDPKICPLYMDSFGDIARNVHILDFLASNGHKQYKYNSQIVQGLESNFCGFFCIYFALCRDLNRSPKKILEGFDKINLLKNDLKCIELIENL